MYFHTSEVNRVENPTKHEQKQTTLPVFRMRLDLNMACEFSGILLAVAAVWTILDLKRVPGCECLVFNVLLIVRMLRTIVR